MSKGLSEWKKQVLASVIELIGGGTPKTSILEYWNGDIPWLSVVDFNSSNKYVFDAEKKITLKGLHNSSSKMLKSGDIIISARGTVGALAVLALPMAFNQSCYGIRGIEGQSITDYIYYLLKDTIANLKQISHGGVFDTITRETFNAITVSLPPLPKQKAIANVLSSLDDKIDLLHRQNKTLESMAETLFRQWFIEEAQEAWEKGIIDDVVSIKGGTTPSTKQQEYWNGDIHWTTPRDLSSHGNIFLFETERKITEKGLAQIGSGLLPAGTVLLSSRAPIGYLVIADIPIAINQGYIAIICDKLASKYFMYLWCKTNMALIKNAGNGSTFDEVSKSNFKAIEINIPPHEKQMDFNECVSSLFEKIRINTKQVNSLEKLRDTLLPKLMSGEVNVIN